MAEAKVTAVIVAYQSRDCIAAALDALEPAHAAGFAECVVVDNACTDGTGDFVAERYPWVRLVRSGGNIGFGRGCNLGFESVATPYVLILNPDAVLEENALQRLVEFLDGKPGAGIAAPAIVEGDGLQAAGLMMTPMTLIRSTLGSSIPFRDRRVIQPDEAPFRTSWVCGAAMLIRSELFRTLGGFDPRFFLYFEETDLCRRAAANGAEIWAFGEAVARHSGGASAAATGKDLTGGCISEHYYRSRLYYLVKHFGWPAAVAAEILAAGAGWARRLRRRFRSSADQRAARLPSGFFLRLPARPEDVR